MWNHLFRLNQFFIKSSITLKPKIEHIVICCFLMGDCLLPIFVHSGKHQISPSFCSLVGSYQEIEANFVFGTLKNTKNGTFVQFLFSIYFLQPRNCVPILPSTSFIIYPQFVVRKYVQWTSDMLQLWTKFTAGTYS